MHLTSKHASDALLATPCSSLHLGIIDFCWWLQLCKCTKSQLEHKLRPLRAACGWPLLGSLCSMCLSSTLLVCAVSYSGLAAVWTPFAHGHCTAPALQVLQQAGLSDVQLVHLASNVYQLQCAFERMAVIKEYRYPCCITSMRRYTVHANQQIRWMWSPRRTYPALAFWASLCAYALCEACMLCPASNGSCNAIASCPHELWVL